MLLDSFEEQLDMPAAFVKPRDGQSRKFEIVGDEEPEPALLLLVIKTT
jgi:hypothetical protein